MYNKAHSCFYLAKKCVERELNEIYASIDDTKSTMSDLIDLNHMTFDEYREQRLQHLSKTLDKLNSRRRRLESTSIFLRRRVQESNRVYRDPFWEPWCQYQSELETD
jgi:hypothetical protein